MSVPAGQVLGAYRLVQRIGRGGMGEVWLGRHLKLGREAAIKVLPASLAGEADFLKRFQREAASAASLEHPNILPVWDYGEQEHTPYLVMPYVSGGTLKDRLSGSGISRTEFLHFFKQMAEALDYAHERGLIHRDVKPANMLIDERDRLYLADFGIAKALEGSEGLTRTGVGVGTPEYMAPEQAQGHADTRSDLYALGIIAYQLLAGRVPYSGNSTVEVLMKHLQEPVPLRPLREPALGLPPDIERLFQKALAKNPNDRYQSAMSLYEALAEALSAPSARAGDTRSTVVADSTIIGGAAAAAAAPVSAASWTPPPAPWQPAAAPTSNWQGASSAYTPPPQSWQAAPGATPPFGATPGYGVPQPPIQSHTVSKGQPWWLWGILAAVVLLLGFGGVVALARGGGTASTPTALPATAVAAAPSATVAPVAAATSPPPTAAPVPTSPPAPTAVPRPTTMPTAVPTPTVARPTATTARATNTPTPRPATTNANLSVSPVAGPVGTTFIMNATGLVPNGQYIFVIYNSANKEVLRTDANKPWVADSAGRLQQLTITTTGDPPDTYTVVVATVQGTERARARYTVTP